LDIDLEKGDLRVQRQIGRIDGKIIEMPLKTKNDLPHLAAVGRCDKRSDATKKKNG